MKRIELLSMMCGACLCTGVFGDVFYSARDAVQAAYAGTNPCTDASGGVWRFEARQWPCSPSSDAVPLATTTSENDSIRGVCRPGDYPCVQANMADVPVVAWGFSGNRSDAPLDPGELILHPAPSGDGRCRSTLVFTVPRTARYSLTAKFRSINMVGSGVADAWILLDDSPVFREQVDHNGRYGDLPPFALTNVCLAAGQTLAFVVGPGFFEASHGWDGVGLKLELVEHAQTEPPATQVWDLGASFSANCAQDTPAMPFADVGGTGEWSCYGINQNSPFLEQTAPVLLDAFTNVHGLVSAQIPGSGEPYPFVRSIPASATAAVDCGGSSWGLPFSATAPGELYFHPGWSRSLVFRFRTPSAGRYAVSYTVRDVDPGCDVPGVVVRLLGGGTLLSRELIAMESRPCAFRQEETPPLPAGASIDFVLENNGTYNNDATAGRLKVFKLADAVAYTNLNAGVALRENVAGAYANPFTDARGVTWTVGSCAAPGGEIHAMTNPNTSGALKGWLENPGSAWDANYPRVLVPPTLGQYGPADTDWLPEGEVLYPNEFLVHPFHAGERQCAVLRFAAPRDGAYRVSAAARDLNAAGANGGVACHLMVGACNLVPSQIVFRYQPWGSHYTALMETDFVNLRAGEAIDLVVGGNWADYTMNSDATAVQEIVHEGEAGDEPILSIDLRANGGAPSRLRTYAARGRAGWSGQTWAETARVGESLSVHGIPASTKDATARTRTAFTLRREEGPLELSALGLGTLMDAGVVSTNASDRYAFTLTELPPEETFTLYLYGLNLVPGDGVARFAAGDAAATPTRSWFTDDYRGRGCNAYDTAVLTARSDASGTLACSFATTSQTNAVAFCGLQVVGPSFRPYVAPGSFMLIR